MLRSGRSGVTLRIVGRVALLSVICIAVAAPAGLGASGTNVTARGAITALRVKSITVHGRTCRITGASPDRATLRLFYVGAEAKIACANGVLRSITSLNQPTMISVPGTSSTAGSGGSEGWSGGGGSASFSWGTDVTAQGTVTSLNSDDCMAGSSQLRCASITVNGVSCAVSLFFYNHITAGISQPFSLGDTATMQCDQTGLLIAIGHNGI